MELVGDDDVGTCEHWKQYCPLQGTHPFWPYQWAPPIQGVPGGWNTSRLKPTNTFIPNFPKHFWPKFNFLLFLNMWMGWKFRIGLDPSPFWMLSEKKIVFLRQLPKRLTSGVETHQACPIVTMSPQGFSGSPYLPWDMVWYVTRIHILFETLPRPECSREEKEKIRSNIGREPSWHDQYYGSAVNLKIPDILSETLVVCKSFISVASSIILLTS